jgi:dihydroxy-acid dehydratase
MEHANGTNGTNGNIPEKPRYIDFPCLRPGSRVDGKQALNRWSSTITRGHDFPGAQAMLYAAGVPNKEMMKSAPHVGISTVWWEGNPCNMHLHELGKTVKDAVRKQGMLGWQFNTIGVSDGITMGGEGMRFSLQSREVIADSIETVTCAQVGRTACLTLWGNTDQDSIMTPISLFRAVIRTCPV